MQKIVLILQNVRSTHNVGSLLRSADGFGINQVILSGYTPYPKKVGDERLPHISEKITRQISKTALGAETTVPWSNTEDITNAIKELKTKGYLIAALEQSSTAKDLTSFNTDRNIALIVGNEVDGIDESTLNQADIHLVIPMQGKKESFNVAVAGSIGLYHLATLDKDKT
jgi:23S rRNA (guanosine2251-2'-O)-methyltransferase